MLALLVLWATIPLVLCVWSFFNRDRSFVWFRWLWTRLLLFDPKRPLEFWWTETVVFCLLSEV